MATIDQVEKALKGMKTEWIYHTYGTNQGEGEDPMFIDVEVVDIPAWADEQMIQEAKAQVAEVEKALEKAGICGYEHSGTISILAS